MKIPTGNGQLSLVALFGDKKQHYPELWKLLEKLQGIIETNLGKGNFSRYEELQVHGTIIGLEGDRDGDTIWNRNCLEIHRKRSAMNLPNLIDFILNDNNPFLPVSINVGGFKKTVTYPFNSRGHTPYFRSFSIQGKITVAMGWPVKNNLYTSDIDKLRRSFNQFNVLHKYHNTNEAYDNDFFFVLGKVSPGLNEEVLNACQNQIRDILAHNDLTPILITKNQLNIVAYPEGDTQLKNAAVINLDEAKAQIEELKRFYTHIGC